MNETENDITTKRCQYCNSVLSGRTDKLFCDDRCRNNYYYKVNNENIEFIRNVNKVLLKNRGILKTLNPYGKTSVQKKCLEEQGFDFQCFTSVYKTRKGRTYYIVYDQAYSVGPQGKVTLLVFNRDTQAIVG